MKKILLIICCFSFVFAQNAAQSDLKQKLQTSVDSLEKIIDNSNEKPTGYQYYDLSWLYSRLGLQARSYAYALKAKELSDVSKDDSLKIGVLEQLARLYLINHLPEKAIEVLHDILKFKNVKNDSEHYLNVLLELASSEYAINSLGSKAKYAFKKYLDEATRLKKYDHQAQAIYLTAINFYHMQNTPEAHAVAIKYYNGVLEVIEKHSTEMDSSFANLYRNNSINNIGDIYEREKQYDNALEYYLKSLVLMGKNPKTSPADKSTVLISVSSIYNIKGDYAQSKKYLLEALSLSESIRSNRERFIQKNLICFELHKAYDGSGERDLSHEYLRKSDLYKDSVIFIESSIKDSSKVITSLETDNIISKIESEKERLQRRDEIKTLQLEKARTGRNYLLGILIFVILTLFLILSRYRMKIIANRNITTISKIGQDITSVLEFEDMLYTFYEDSNKLMEVDAFGLGFVVDNNLSFRFFINNNQRVSEFNDDLSDSSSPAVHCAVRRKELLINDISLRPEFKDYFINTIPGNKLKSALYLPLISKDKLLGVLTVLCNKKNGYIDQHLNMLKTLASYLTIALDNSRVYTELNTLNRDLKYSNEIIKSEQEKSDRLLLNILPAKVANDLKAHGTSQPEVFKNVSVMFTDLVDFTKTSAKLSAQEVIDELNDLFSNFDRIISKNGCLRIKTIGDAYLAVSGMPEPDAKHTEKLFKSAVEIIEYLSKRNQKHQIKWLTRIGINSGEVVGGIIGIEKYIYDIFGDTVNVAFRMEQLSLPMQINITGAVYAELKDRYDFKPREGLQVKGCEGLEVWFTEF